jgi:glucose/arabinose dehydrogenase
MKKYFAIATVLSTVILASPQAGGKPSAIGATPVVTGLDYPAAFTFAPDGRIFYGERFTGEIRIYDPSNGSDTLFFTINQLVTSGEQGLLGLALHPLYPTRPAVYAYATREVGGSPRNQIIRIIDSGGVGTTPRAIWTENIVASSIHNGGHIQFGPDRRLYAVVGEANDPANSQDLSVTAGKVLRMTENGKVPPDNPFPGSVVWAYGLRNSFGFTFDPLTDLMWQSENGPACNDEINIEKSGENHGWGPNETCSTPPPPPQNTNQDGPSPVLPLTYFTPTIAPVGAAFCVGCGIGTAEGTLFLGAYNDFRIRQITLTSNRMGIQMVTNVYTHSTYPLSLERGPDQAVYFSDQSGIWKLVQA